ncbi:hypothetical protein FKM82_010958 [Ascaphus truei]
MILSFSSWESCHIHLDYMGILLSTVQLEGQQSDLMESNCIFKDSVVWEDQVKMGGNLVRVG